MHIKQITISNFRSFKSQPEIQPFSSHCNVVVGRNGSGKSNLFDAVQFVLLSPKFYSLRTEERQALLHEGSGAAAVNAFVEIVFDNSDNRFNIESTTSDEVVLRRTIGHKKDEFFLQRKRAQKTEIMSLLEGAGFSKSNPYFIVQQGKVNALCTMSDAERLALLKEVAGTTVYDEKKSESLARMSENEADIAKISEMLAYIDERLQELEGEKEELTAYQQLDRSRRAVEYTLYDKELKRARETVDDIEHMRVEEAERLAQLHEGSRKTHDAIRSFEAKMKQRSHGIRRVRMQISSLEEQKLKKLTLRTKLEVECRELQEYVQHRAKTQKQNQKDMRIISSDIDKTSKELRDTAQPAYEAAREELTKTTLEREDAVKRMDGLYAKQNRGRSFSNKGDRDRYINSQVKELNASLRDKEKLLKSKQDAFAKMENKIEAETSSFDSKKASVLEKQGLSTNLLNELQDKKKNRNTLADTRRDLWRSIDDLSERLTELREDHRKVASDLSRSTPRATALGLEALARIVREERIPNDVYIGTIMENLELKDESFRTAVEVAAGNSLHHVIVDTDATAAHLMGKLERGKLGRVTFLPLNQLHFPRVHYPESPDVAPLISRCVSYHPRVDRAMQQVFGKKLLARNADIASQWSRQCDMDAITLEGDLCSRKGALTGGFVDNLKSKLRLFAQKAIAQKEIDTHSHKLDGMQKNNTNLDQKIATVMGEMQQIDAQRANLNHDVQRLQDELSSLEDRIGRKKHTVEEITEVIPTLEGECHNLEGQIEALREEMGTELTSQLTEEEQRSLETLKQSQKHLEQQMEHLTQQLEEASLQRQRLQSYLNDNLLRRKKEIEEQEQAPQFSTEEFTQNREADLPSLQKELADAINEEKETEASLEECKGEEEQMRKDLISSKTELEKLKAQDSLNSQSLEAAADTGDRLLNKRSMNIGKREMYIRKIQELGSLPPSKELSSFIALSIHALMRKLEAINKDLKKYSHVNKKAYDQYVNFSEQREVLLGRKKELDDGADKVRELVESLDHQKDEAINRTFRGVSAHFKDVFKDLVPNGYGELIMKTALPDDDADSDDSESEEEEKSSRKKKKGKKKAKKTTTDYYDPSNPDVSMYRGIGIKVRFSPIGENFLMSQLSGGQKALVALGLIFAIQRCDPAPFYLFDELDQALDSTYRAAVASVIHRQANSEENPTQFICSTFRPELAGVADSCYGISHQNKVSNLHLLSKPEALHFIADLMSAEEAVGEVSVAARSKASSGTSKKKQRRAQEEDEDVVA